MGQQSAKFRSLRRSFRRLSLTKSAENVKKTEKLRHCRSLSNLNTKRRSAILTSKKSVNDLSKSCERLEDNSNQTKTEEIIRDAEEKENRPLISLNRIINDGVPFLLQIEKLEQLEDKNASLVLINDINGKIKELNVQIEDMNLEDLFLYHATFKDSIHNFWIKCYEVKEIDGSVKVHKNHSIDYIKYVLHRLNHRVYFRSKNNIESTC